MSLPNPTAFVTEERLNEYHNTILSFLGGMPDILANKFARGDMYSTDEKMIGQWIDGKPLYQRVYTLSSAVTVSNSSFTTISEIDVSTMDRTFNVFGVSESVDYSCPMMLTTDEGYFKVMTLRNDNSIRVKYVALQYTKTTDSPISIGNDTDYSTTEKIIGTWIDGKPIYQKTIDCGALPNNTTKSVAHGISNIDAIIEIRGSAYNDNHNGISIPSVDTNSTYNVSVDKTGDYIRISTGADRSSLNHSYVTIQYTKTTD